MPACKSPCTISTLNSAESLRRSQESVIRAIPSPVISNYILKAGVAFLSEQRDRQSVMAMYNKSSPFALCFSNSRCLNRSKRRVYNGFSKISVFLASVKLLFEQSIWNMLSSF